MEEKEIENKISVPDKEPVDMDGRKNVVNKDNDTEFSPDIAVDDLVNSKSFYERKATRNLPYTNDVDALPGAIKALIIISWICAALAGFVSVYFAIIGIVSAYAASRIVPGVGRTALITNVILAVINLLLSFAFMQTVRNIFALL